MHSAYFGGGRTDRSRLRLKGELSQRFYALWPCVWLCKIADSVIASSVAGLERSRESKSLKQAQPGFESGFG